jgi:hypothetical protein
LRFCLTLRDHYKTMLKQLAHGRAFCSHHSIPQWEFVSGQLYWMNIVLLKSDSNGLLLFP